MLPLLTTLCLVQSPDIKTTLETYAKAVIEFDVATLDRVLADDYLEVSPLGDVDERARVLSFYRVPPAQRGPKPSAYILADWKIRQVSPTVSVAVYREDFRMSGREIRFRVTSVLRRNRTGWKLVSNHVNGIGRKS